MVLNYFWKLMVVIDLLAKRLVFMLIIAEVSLPHAPEIIDLSWNSLKAKEQQ